MGLDRERVVELVNDAYGWTDLGIDSLERTDAYDTVQTKVKEYEEARAEEEDAASRAAGLAEDLAEFGIDVETDL